MLKFTAVAVAALLNFVNADVYLHNPAGSNDRNRERNDNRNNGNRLFDSQNNAKGGYPWRGDRELQNAPDPLVVYEGSNLQVEWTAQHGCGTNPNLYCDMIMQYACEKDLPGLRDGYPSGPLAPIGGDVPDFNQATFVRNNGDGTNTVNQATKDDTEYGSHETYDMYTAGCTGTQRNKGLYTADQKLNGDDASKTRQNPNGDRHGWECPEERDYYPYWNPSPWTDIAVQTSNLTWCQYYQAQSQNVKSSFACLGVPTGTLAPISQAACTAAAGTWTEIPSRNIAPPDCKVAAFSRDNHLGNTDVTALGEPQTSSYTWSVPFLSTMFTRPKWPLGSTAGATPILDSGATSALCVFRLRYNVTTNDYPSKKGFDMSGDAFFDARFNCASVSKATVAGDNVDAASTTGSSSTTCGSLLDDGNRPRYNRPYVNPFTDATTPSLSIAMNTDQVGRTFQDRTYVMRIAKRPATVANSAVIWNLNNRGKRGNIVQSYPAVEYDFTPKNLVLNRNDVLHVQFHGSDFNTARDPNNAEGWRYSDRFNMVQVQELNTQIPWKVFGTNANMFTNEAEAKKYALLDQTGCVPFKAGDAGEQNSKTNCGKLNAAPAHFDFGLKNVAELNRGAYEYLSTRNNNFSNRSQKATMVVQGFTTAESVGIGLGVVAGVSAVAAGGIFAFKRGYLKAPEGSFMHRISNAGSRPSAPSRT